MRPCEIPTLYLCVGLPYSGKSTWAKEQKMPIVSPDAIRIALHGERYKQEAEPMVWAIAEYMVKSLFLAGHNHVILDATNTTKKRRLQWKSEHWRCRIVHQDIGKEECIKRAKENNDLEIIPIIERMAESFETITILETNELNANAPKG